MPFGICAVIRKTSHVLLDFHHIGWHPQVAFRTAFVETPESLLRPEWIFQIARAIDAFVRSMNRAPAVLAEIERFFSALPPPNGEMERRVLAALHDGLASTPPACSKPTPAECARQLLIDHYCKPWTLSDLAKAVGSNRTTLQEQFRLLTHTTVHQFLVKRRVSVAQQLLKQSDVKVSCVPREVGYHSQSAFARHFKKVTGIGPRAYRKSCPPAELHFSTQSLSNERAQFLEDDSENR